MIEDIETTGHVDRRDARSSGSRWRWTISAPATPRSAICGRWPSISSRSTAPSCSNIVNSEDDRFFVRTLDRRSRIILKLKIVAEWVEDEATAAMLREWGVDYFQGALFGDAPAATRAEASDSRRSRRACRPSGSAPRSGASARPPRSAGRSESALFALLAEARRPPPSRRRRD